MVKRKLRPIPLLSAMLQRCWLLLIMSSLILSSCANPNPNAPPPDPSELATVGAMMVYEGLRFSVLNLNIRQTAEENGPLKWGAWEARYDRIALGLAITGKKPDFIVLQEALGTKVGEGIKSYDSEFELIKRIKEKTGVTYRIAYLIVSPTSFGIPGLHVADDDWEGDALLYNPDRIVNRTPHPTDGSIPIVNWDDRSRWGMQFHKSLPCEPSDQYKDLCSLVDGDGLAWISPFAWPHSGAWLPGPEFARFSLKSALDYYIHIYNVHARPKGCCDYSSYTGSFKKLVGVIQHDYGSQLLYPPLAVGDFNLSKVDALHEFPGFEDAGWAGDGAGIEGVLMGKQSDFPSNRKAYVIETLTLPLDYLDQASRARYENDPAGCGGVGNLWSDHCGLFIQYSPLDPSTFKP